MSAPLGRPDSFEPHGEGTVIFSGNAAGAASNHFSLRPASSLSKRNDQRPFRFSQSGRSKSGRGCSGSGIGSAGASAESVEQAPAMTARDAMISNERDLK